MKAKEIYFVLLCLTFTISTALMMVGSIFEIDTCSMVGYVFLLISGFILLVRGYVVQRSKKGSIL